MNNLILAGFAAAALLTAADLAAAAPARHPDLSGVWVLQDPTVDAHASLTAEGARRLKVLKSGQGLDVAAGSPAYASLWCTAWGFPGQMTSTLPIDIRQSPIETAIMSTVRQEPRHIYTDVTTHPSTDVFDFTSVGHSIGHWEGQTFVADTRYFSGDGVTLLPGDGVRTQKSVAKERFRLADADTLTVTTTWTDPTTLKRPLTYVQTFKRAKEQVSFADPVCNPLKAMRAKHLPLPPDAPAD